MFKVSTSAAPPPPVSSLNSRLLFPAPPFIPSTRPSIHPSVSSSLPGWMDGSSPSCLSIGSRLSGCHWSGGAQKATELSGFETPGAQNTNLRHIRPQLTVLNISITLPEWPFAYLWIRTHAAQPCGKGQHCAFRSDLETFCATFILPESVSLIRLCFSFLGVVSGLPWVRRGKTTPGYLVRTHPRVRPCQMSTWWKTSGARVKGLMTFLRHLFILPLLCSAAPCCVCVRLFPLCLFLKNPRRLCFPLSGCTLLFESLFFCFQATSDPLLF